MRKLLRADFARIRKQKVFWAGFLALAGYHILAFVDRYRDTVPVWGDDLLFIPALLEGVCFAVFCSLFAGTEYSDGTIRNKLIIGQSRTSIYLASFISCAAASVMMVVMELAAACAAGLLLMGKPSVNVPQAARTAAVALFLCMSYSAVYNLTAMLSSSKTHTAVINILLSFGMLFAAIYLFRMLGQPEMIHQYVLTDGEPVIETVPNSRYLTGMKRDIFQFLFDFLPAGQSGQIAEFTAAKRPALLCLYSLVLTAAVNFAGVVLFRRKDIK